MVDVEGAVLADRSHCISCGSPRLESLSRGRYGDEPLRGYIERDPWGESPLLDLRRGEPPRVLDFGCGWGQFLSAAVLFGAEAYGVDRDADRLRSAGKGGTLVVARLEELPQSLRGRFDSISLFQVLEHLEEPR